MNRLLRHIRLLPLVIVVGFSLLGVKGFGLLHAAQAESAGESEPTEQTEGAHHASDDAAIDPADDESELGSTAEVDVLTSLTKRRKQLDEREQQIAMRENVIIAATQRVDTRINELKALQAAIQTLLGQRDAEEQKQIASLVKTYSSMKAKDAARIFDTLDSDVRLSVAQLMKSDVLAPILAAMQASEAQKITIALANRMKVTPPPVAPAPVPAAPAPDGTQPPVTTAAATPPGTPPVVPADLPSTTPPATADAAAHAPPVQTADAAPKAPPAAPKPHAPKPHAKPKTAKPVTTTAATPPAQSADNHSKTPAASPVQTAATTPKPTTASSTAAPKPTTDASAAMAHTPAPATASPPPAAQKPGG